MKAAARNTTTVPVMTEEIPAAAITHSQDAEISPTTFSRDVVVKHVTTTITAMMALHLRSILVSPSCALKTSFVLSVLVLYSVLMISVLLPVLVVQVLDPSVQNRVTN